MKLIEIKDNSEYENFVSKQVSATLLQSWGWREVLANEDKEPSTYFIQQDEEILAALLVSKYYVPGGFYYLYSPRGPVSKNELNTEQKNNILDAIGEQLKSLYQDAIFWRIDPEEKFDLAAAGFVKADKEMQPHHSQVLDLTKSEDELMADMKSKTRYNIRLAEKKGVEIFEAAEKDLDIFYKLLVDTAGRDDFYLHSKEHYENLWKNLRPQNLHIYLARYEQKMIAGVMIGQYNNQAIYLHGASDYKYRSLMAPYLLQWHAIVEAKKKGNIIYDFHGVAPKDASPKHPWSGITRFKQGFGGEYIEYAGTYDFVYRKFMYWMFNVLRSLVKTRNKKQETNNSQ